jgi:GntR family transcriptional regulator
MIVDEDVMSSSAVDRNLALPLHHQVYVALRNRILERNYCAGDFLPSEHDLATQFGVSRITIRRALNELAARDLIVRQQGKGTRVADCIPRAHLQAGMEGLLGDTIRMAAATSVEVLEFEYVRADRQVAEALHVALGDRVQWAVRVRRWNGMPFSYLVTYLPESIGRSFTRAEMASTSLMVLLERSGVVQARAEQTISASAATPAIAHALDLPAGAPILHTTRLSFDGRGLPVEYLSASYRPDLYSYSMSMEPHSGPGGVRWVARGDIGPGGHPAAG